MIKGYFHADIYTPSQDENLYTRLKKAMYKGKISGLGMQSQAEDFCVYWFDLELEIKDPSSGAAEKLVKALSKGYEYSIFFYIPSLGVSAIISDSGIIYEDPEDDEFLATVWADVEVIAPGGRQ